MSELQQLKERINNQGYDGLATEIIRDDYEPAGDMMIKRLVDAGEFITRRVSNFEGKSYWRIFTNEFKPY